MAIENGHSNGAAAPVDESIAVKANAIDEVPRLLEEVAAQGKALAQGGEKDRRRLMETVRALNYALETPREAMIRYCWSQVRSYPSAFSLLDLLD